MTSRSRTAITANGLNSLSQQPAKNRVVRLGYKRPAHQTRKPPSLDIFKSSRSATIRKGKNVFNPKKHAWESARGEVKANTAATRLFNERFQDINTSAFGKECFRVFDSAT